MVGGRAQWGLHVHVLRISYYRSDLDSWHPTTIFHFQFILLSCICVYVFLTLISWALEFLLWGGPWERYWLLKTYYLRKDSNFEGFFESVCIGHKISNFYFRLQSHSMVRIPMKITLFGTWNHQYSLLPYVSGIGFTVNKNFQMRFLNFKLVW